MEEEFEKAEEELEKAEVIQSFRLVKFLHLYDDLLKNQQKEVKDLEKKYNDLKSKREQRIRDLEDEKLSYTATLEGLTERIRSLQDAIAQEEQTLTGYKKSA